MATKKVKNQTLQLRVSDDERRKFINQAAKYGGTSYVLRELVVGFIENRVTIQPPAPEKIYHVENV